MNTRSTKWSASSNDNLPPLLNANKKRKDEPPITKRCEKHGKKLNKKKLLKTFYSFEVQMVAS